MKKKYRGGGLGRKTRRSRKANHMTLKNPTLEECVKSFEDQVLTLSRVLVNALKDGDAVTIGYAILGARELGFTIEIGSRGPTDIKVGRSPAPPVAPKPPACSRCKDTGEINMGRGELGDGERTYAKCDCPAGKSL